jgi:RimJ/RimL family protein N-acetyltransferase
MQRLIRILTGNDASAYQRLRLLSLQESPSAFSASYSEEEARSLEEVARRVTPAADGSICAFGAFAGEELVGLLAFVRPSREKLRHAAELCGMYVAPKARRSGYGCALLDAALRHACSQPGLRQLKLSVNVTNAAACALYESHGFVRAGVEPEALCVNGRFYDDALYILRLPGIA